MSSRDRLFRFRYALLPLVLPMAGCEKIDGFWTWSGWTAVGVAVAIIGVIVARDRSGSVEQTAKGNDITQINNPGGGNVGDVNSPKTINIYNTTIQQISQNKSVPIEVLRSILASMGEKELDEAGPEKIEAILKAKADEYLQLNERLRHLGDSDPKVAEFKEKAAQTLQRGQFQEADDYLAQAEQLDRQAIKQQKTTIRKRCASAANTLAERADIARLQPNPASYRQAAEFFAQAADLVADSDAAQARSYQRQQASTLYDLGNECGQNAVLEEAVALYWQILSSTRRETEPLDWAGTQNNLGIALSILGERRGDEAQLQEAVTAYREALKEYTRERAPLQWAMTQNNLGNVFRALGDLRGDEAQLRESVTAYREALKERTRKRAPLDWAMTQNNLGAVLQTLGSRRGDEAQLQESVTAYREALKERTREHAPLDWAATQNNLGTVLQTLGDLRGDEVQLQEAVTAYREALKEYTRERAPLNWATTQNNLGAVLQTLGSRRGEEAQLQESVTAFREALKERTRERAPLDWAMTQNNLGNVLQTLGSRRGDEAQLQEAVTAYREALKEYTRERAPLNWATTQNNLGAVLQTLGSRRGDEAQLQESVTAYRAALEVFSESSAAHYVQGIKRNLSRAEAALEQLKKLAQ